MGTNKNDIIQVNTKQVPNLIRKLEGFLGYKPFSDALKKYQMIKNCHHGSYLEYYIKPKHPWWEAFLEYKNLEQSGKSLTKNPSEKITRLAGDATKIYMIQKTMPESVKKKYRENLLDFDNAANYLFELHMAWHYQSEGHEIRWPLTDHSKVPEFSVHTKTTCFNVECKRISVDKCKNILRPDFYNLIDKLCPNISSLGFEGNIEIIVFDKIPKNKEKFNTFLKEILEGIKEGNIKISFKTSFCEVKPNLRTKVHNKIELKLLYNNLLQKKPFDSYASIFCDENKLNPIELICRSEKPVGLIDGIRKVLSKAGSEQLDEKKGAIILVNIAEIDDFTPLSDNSDLQRMTNTLFSSEKRNHIAAIIYSSEIDLLPDPFGRKFYTQALMFRNHFCKFGELKDFNFIRN